MTGSRHFDEWLESLDGINVPSQESSRSGPCCHNTPPCRPIPSCRSQLCCCLGNDCGGSFCCQRISHLPDFARLNISRPSQLITECAPISFTLGTGESTLSQICQKSLSLVQEELLIVTCFWASSPSQQLIAQLLRDLSEKACRNGGTIRVRICFSSLSIIQKLFEPQDGQGQIWPASSWESKFGLPSGLPGIDLVVKSMFLLPFSVMHPKFVIVDRRRAFLPSCNISWEKWFEGCVEFEGALVDQFVRFFDLFWMSLPNLGSPQICPSGASGSIEDVSQPTRSLSNGTTPAVFLPSPHHRRPQFRPFLSPAPPPRTPLNSFILSLIESAKKDIYIQTPNLTSMPVINALLEATKLGIDVHIVTNTRLMILEQLVTAGTTTELSVWCMLRKYRSMNRSSYTDEETPISKIGDLKVEWFTPKMGGQDEEEPVKSHLKLCIVDGEVTVLGSGNLDRASWYTSQEIGVAFHGKEFAETVQKSVREALLGRLS